MSRQVKDAREITTGDLIYFRGHAKATYMSNGQTVEDALANAGIPDAPSDDTIYGRKNGEWVDVNQEFEPIGTIKTSEMGNVFGDKYVACDGSLLDLEDYPDILKTNYPLIFYKPVKSLYLNNLRKTRFINNTYIYIDYKSISYSTDFINWTSATVNVEDIAYGNGIYVGILYGNGGVAYSTDLNTWTTVPDIKTNNWGYTVAFVNGFFLIIESTKILKSTDGKNWTTLTANYPGATIIPERILYFNNTYIAILGTDLYYFTSKDLINWDKHTLPSCVYEYQSDFASFCIFKNTLYFILGNGFVKIKDDWSFEPYYISPPFAPTTYNAYDEIICDDKYIYIPNLSTGVPTMISTGNSSVEYVNNSNLSVFRVFHDGSQILFYDNTGLYKIDDTKYQLPNQANSYIKVRK